VIFAVYFNIRQQRNQMDILLQAFRLFADTFQNF